MIRIGLTGSIGMGKTTTAQMFAEQGVPVFNADDAVHKLYSGRAAPLIETAFPGTVHDGVVDRKRLSQTVLNDPVALKELESIVHPLVRHEEQQFLANAKADGAEFVLLDIPLLYEAGRAADVDTIVVVSAEPDIQRQRVLARAGMSEEKFAAILARQMPDADKRARADHIIDTGKGMDAARAQVRAIIAQLRRSGCGNNSG
jgi:dephospho-CoA kinase